MICRRFCLSVLIAIGEGGCHSGSFDLLVSHAQLDLVPGATGTLHVLLSPSDGFSDDVTVEVVAPPAGITADPLRLPAGTNAGDLTIHAAPGAHLDSEIAILAEAAGGEAGWASGFVTVGSTSGIIDRSFGNDGYASANLSPDFVV